MEKAIPFDERIIFAIDVDLAEDWQCPAPENRNRLLRSRHPGQIPAAGDAFHQSMKFHSDMLMAAVADGDFFLDFSPFIALSDQQNLRGSCASFSQVLATNRMIRGDVP